MAVHTFKCIDAHSCGNPVRLIVEGGPVLIGASMSEKRQHFLSEFDWIRKGLMFEPRGHDMMSGTILYPPNDRENDAAILFIETSGCLPMCGHGLIGTVTIALEEGLLTPTSEGYLKMETPAGVVRTEYQQEGKKVVSVKLTNVGAYLAEENILISCPELGELTVDVSFGGNFYAIVDQQANFSGIQNHTAEQLIGWSREVRNQINLEHRFVHPKDPTINGLSHVLWAGVPIDPASTARNAVFYGEKAIDRSPCGTGTSARMAQWHSKGKLKVGDEFIHESIIGSKFVGRIESEAMIANQKGIIPSVEGWARIYGHNLITIDDEDPYSEGFQVI